MNQFLEYTDDGDTVIYYNPTYQRAESVARWVWDLFGRTAAIKSPFKN